MGRMFTLGSHCPLTEMTNPKPLEAKKWKATGRNFPLVTKCYDDKSVAPTSVVSSMEIIACTNPVFPKYVCDNQLDPNHTWGSTFFSYPYLSSFKCRSYKSSYGIWTQADQNI